MSNLELPEIETLRRDLDREFVGRKVKSAEAHILKSIPGLKDKSTFGQELIGAKVTGATRKALHLVLSFDNDYSLVMSLGENGRLEKVTGKADTASDVVAIIGFTQGGDLHLSDKKGTSAYQIVHDDDLEVTLPPVADVGLDLLESPLSWVDFGRLVMGYKMPMMLLLTDPTVFVGIGDIYSNEILFDAGLRYDRNSNDLSTQEIRRLYRSVVGILHDAIKYRGTSLEDRPFFDLLGQPGEYADHLAVYGKAGEMSPRSREPILKTSFKHHPVFYCNTQV